MSTLDWLDKAPSTVPVTKSERSPMDAGGGPGRSLLVLQNRWSASLAMSTDGSFPSRPRHFELGQRS